MIKIGVVGAAGYTGGELLRLLINHPEANIVFIHSNSSSGQPISAVHADLAGETDLRFTDQMNEEAEIVFLCVGHGEAKKFLQQNKISEAVKVIDLSQDFRLLENQQLNGRNFVYGLPELNKEQIRHADSIANPGCFATALQLGLLPLAKAGVLTDVYSTGITGSTGAGQGLSASSHFSWRANNIQAYKTLTHQHLHEINQSIQQLTGGKIVDISFVPWRGDFTRGIFISSQLRTDLSFPDIEKIFDEYYREHPFCVVSKDPIFLKQVVNTNKCLIQLESTGNKLVVHTIIDNLLKGASGQAIQNMNLMFGIDETTGLKLKANYF